MARQMFYTLEEAAQRLGVDPQAVKDMAAQGQLQQFRDRDQLMFKRDEVEGLAAAGDTTADSPIGLGDTTADAPTLSPDDTAGESEPIPLDASDDTQGGGEIQLSPDDTDSTDAITPSNTGTGTDAISLAEEDSVPEPSSADSSAGSMNAADETGVSVFDADEVEQADPTAQTQVNQGAVGDEEELALDTVGSGSGLLDLTRETDDTSLGAAELLDEIGPGGGGGETAGSLSGSSSSGLLDATQPGQQEGSADAGTGLEAMEAGTQIAMEQQPEEVAGEAVLPSTAAVPEAYDPAGSGFGAGMLIGAGAALVLSLLIVAAAIFGARSPVLDLMVGEPGAENAGTLLMIWCGGLLAGSFLLGIVGMLAGKAAEGKARTATSG